MTLMRSSIAAATSAAVIVAFALGGPDTVYDSLIQLNRSLTELAIPAGDLQDFDLSPQEMLERGARVRSIRHRLLAMEVDRWPVSQKVDYLLVLSRSNDLEFQYRIVRPWLRDPGYYLDRIRTVPHVKLPLARHELEKFQGRLRSVPKLLSQARENLSGEASRTLADLALFHLTHYDGVGQGEPLRSDPPAGVIGWYQDLLQRLAEEHPQLRIDAEKALTAVQEYRDWLDNQRTRMSASCLIGLEKYSWYLKHVRLMPFTAEQVADIGQREYDRSVTFLRIEQTRNRDLPQLEVAASGEEYESRVRAAEEHIRSFIRRNRLMTIPEDIPPQETDAFWRAGMKRHFWEELQYRDALNNHIHASIPGHRLDMLMASKITHPIRSATRDGGRIEGWAFYIEEMLLQAGLLDERPRARELFYIAQIARAVRIPTELKMQAGELSFDDAIRFMIDRVPFMEENLARYDLEIYLRNPTYGMNYVMGRVQLEQLLAERVRQVRNDFDLGEFHDEFLSYGLIPISMIRWEMNEKDEEAQMLWRELRR